MHNLIESLMEHRYEILVGLFCLFLIANSITMNV